MQDAAAIPEGIIDERLVKAEPPFEDQPRRQAQRHQRAEHEGVPAEGEPPGTPRRAGITHNGNRQSGKRAPVRVEQQESRSA